MLSDEERQAIKFLEKLKDLKIILSCSFWNNGEFEFNNIQKEQFDIILGLIEKQSKEIEELKVINQMQRYRIEVIDEREFISKNTVKAKIEEVEQWELYNMKIPRLSTLDERLGAKIGIKYVLQSLLEKE